MKGFPCGSDGKESACSAGDPGSIPGLARSPGCEDLAAEKDRRQKEKGMTEEMVGWHH